MTSEYILKLTKQTINNYELKKYPYNNSYKNPSIKKLFLLFK